MVASCKTRRNPRTRRCVDVNGKIGRHLVGRPRWCDSIRNVRSGRCVLRKKSSTHSLKRRNSKADNLKLTAICVPNNFKALAERCSCIKHWRAGTKLGSGAYGKVYHAVKMPNTGTKYALKIQKYDKYAKAELAYLKLRKQRSPVDAAWTCKEKLTILDKLCNAAESLTAG